MDKIGQLFAILVIGGLLTPMVCYLVYNNVVNGNWSSTGSTFMGLAIGTTPIVALLYSYTLIRRKKKKQDQPPVGGYADGR